jgi:carboxyl-terminal processing protease
MQRTAHAPVRAIAVRLLLACAMAWPLLAHARAHAARARAALPACKALNEPKDLLTGHASDVDVVEQGYRCILQHYITGKTLDDRVLLRGAFKEIAQSLPANLSDMTLPSLLGDRDVDWQIFANTYGAIALLLSQTPSVQQALAELALFGMTQSLHDDHLSYWPPDEEKVNLAHLNPDTPAPALGIVTSPITATTTSVFITDVLPRTPAASSGLKPGDIVEKVDGHAVFAQGQETGALASLTTPALGMPVSVTVERPATGAQITMWLQPRSLLAPTLTARALAGTIAYVKLYQFSANAAAQVFAAIKALPLSGPARGLILDLRGDPGGEEDQAVRLLSAFVHARTVGYEVGGAGHRHALRTDDTVPLLHLPLVVLTDGGSASSSELVAGAVRDLRLGLVVGSRTAGDLAGAYFYSLSDASALEITQFHVLDALGETVDGVGIDPNQQATVTAQDLSTGDDPVIDRAVQDLDAASQH